MNERINRKVKHVFDIGIFEEVMLIQNAAEPECFKERYGITEEIEKIY